MFYCTGVILLSISRKKLLIAGVGAVAVMNALIVGVLYFAGVIF